MDLNTVLEQWSPIILKWTLRLVGAAAVLVLGWLAARMVRGFIRKALGRAEVDRTLIPFLSSLAYYLTLIVMAIAVLGLFGVETASLVAVLGATSLAIGLALQGTLANFAAGLMLLIFRPFRVGDYVEAGGVRGSVQEIGIFSSVLLTPDNRRIIVPNGKIYGDTIENVTAMDTRRVDLKFGVSYDDDLNVAKETMLRIASAHPMTLDEPAPQVEVLELGDSSVNFVCRPWCRTENYWTVYFQLQKQMKEGLEAAGCTIPFPQRDVHLHGTASEVAANRP